MLRRQPPEVPHLNPRMGYQDWSFPGDNPGALRIAQINKHEVLASNLYYSAISY